MAEKPNSTMVMPPVAAAPPAERVSALSAMREADVRDETARLRAEVGHLRSEIRDHQTALLAANEHSDALEADLSRLSASLASEIAGRQAGEEKLQRLVQATSREKEDLEAIVQILIDQGDDAAEEGAKARIDGLTQIPNRRRLDEYLTNEWARHRRLRQPISLLICDVDHFKLYNDTYGHQAGDECLRAVATAINHRYRPGMLVARYGGEEFAVVLPHTELAAAVAVAGRIRAAVASAAIPHPASPVCDRVTLSIGVGCRIPAPDDDRLRLLVEEADRNLYLAKQGGRNAIHSNEDTIGSL